MSSPKLVMNKEKTKVLFAEANYDFINVLLSFLALPLGKVVEILNGYCAVPGSLLTLYAGLSCLDDSYLCARGAKQMLLIPQIKVRFELIFVNSHLIFIMPFQPNTTMFVQTLIVDLKGIISARILI